MALHGVAGNFLREDNGGVLSGKPVRCQVAMTESTQLEGFNVGNSYLRGVHCAPDNVRRRR